MTSDAARERLLAMADFWDNPDTVVADDKLRSIGKDIRALIAERDEAQDCARESAEAMRRIRDERDALRSERDELKNHWYWRDALATVEKERAEAEAAALYFYRGEYEHDAHVKAWAALERARRRGATNKT